MPTFFHRVLDLGIFVGYDGKPKEKCPIFPSIYTYATPLTTYSI